MEVLSGEKIFGTRIYRVKSESLPKNSYVLSTQPAQKIIYNPLVCGLELSNLARSCSEEFLRIAWRLVPPFRRLGGRRISELVVLRGSLGYHFGEAYQKVFGRYLPKCFVGARRYRISGGEFGAEISYTSFDALPDRGMIFTGDTIATGISLSQTLAITRSELRARDYDIRGLVVFTIAGSRRGSSRLLEWEERFREWWPNFRVYIFACEAFFGLADNGTDLLFRHPEALLPEETKERVSGVYGDYERGYLPEKICAIFDWGDRNFKPERHLEDVVKFCKEHLKRTRERKARQVLLRLMRGARMRQRRLNQALKLRKR